MGADHDADMVTVVHTDPTIPANPSPSSHPLLDVDTYLEVRSELGRGGMGAILEGTDVRIRRNLAIKVMLEEARRSPTTVARFVAEAQIQGQLEHPNICPVHEMGTDRAGRPYFTMKKVRGASLDDLLDENFVAEDEGETEPHSLIDLLRILVKVCDAVAFAHSRGVIHRDIKPENIMIGQFGEALLMDWGLAKVVGLSERDEASSPQTSFAGVDHGRAHDSESLSQMGQIMGTPSFMPPEQARGHIDRTDERSDVYTLGGVLYSILCLRMPFEGDVDEIIQAKQFSARPEAPRSRTPDRDIPQDLAAAAMKAMHPDPAERYPDAQTFKRELLAFMEGRRLRAADYTPLQITRMWIIRNKAFSLTALVSALVLLVTSLIFVANLDSARNAAEAALIRSLMTSAGSAVQLRHWDNARQQYQSAEALLATHGDSTLPAKLGAWNTYRFSPQPLTVVERAAEVVHAVEVDASGRVFYSGGGQQVTSWDLLTGQKQRSFDPGVGEIIDVSLSPDGSTLLAAGDTGKIALLDSSTLRPKSGWDAGVERHSAAIKTAQYAATGDVIISVGRNKAVRVWDANSGEAVTEIRGADRAAISGDGLQVVLRTQSGLAVRDLETGRDLGLLEDRDSWVTALAWTPDGRHIVAGCLDKRIRIWSVATGKLTRVLTGHHGVISQARVSNDGRLIASSDIDGRVRLWDLPSGRETRTFSVGRDRILGLAFSDDGRVLVSGTQSGRLHAWRVGESLDVRTLGRRRSPISAVALSADGVIAAAGTQDGQVQVWETRAGLQLHDLEGHAAEVTTLDFTAKDAAISGSQDGTVHLWDLAAGKERAKLMGHEAPVVATAVRGDRLLTADDSGFIHTWDTNTRQRVATLKTGAAAGQVVSVAFTRGSRNAVLGLDHGEVALWSLGDGAKGGAEIDRHKEHVLAVTQVILSADDRQLWSSSRDSTLLRWVLDPLTRAPGVMQHEEDVYALALSGDERVLASGERNGELKLWDARTGDALYTFRSSTSAITSLDLSGDGSKALVGRKNGEIQLWDFSRIEGHTRPVDRGDAEALGRWFAFRGECRAALEAFAGSDDPVSLIDRALCYLQLEQYDRARAWLLKAETSATDGHTQAYLQFIDRAR